MKVLAINSSARKDGNTAIAIKTVFDILNEARIETELVQLPGLVIEPCKACGGKGETAFTKKDVLSEVFDKMKEADGIILGLPIYSANVSANMQSILDRAAVVCDMNPGIFAHKVGISVTAARRDGALNALDTMNHFFLNHEMFVAGSTCWNMAYGQMPGDVQQDEEGITTMKNIGKNMLYLLEKLGKQ